MFKLLSKEKKRILVMPKHLTKAEKKQVREIIKNAQKNDGVPKTAQQSIPFDRMFQDGICRIGQDYYTKTIQFQDINYQLAQQEDKTEIFEEWCSFLNFFDSSVHFQLSFMNMATDIDDFRTSIAIPHQGDGFNSVRDEYSSMLFHQMEAGNNGLTKTKFLTFGIHADSMRSAKPRIIHIETDILNNFKRLGVQAKILNGKERLALMHQQFHMGDIEKFIFDWKYLNRTGLTVKDFIAPSGFGFPTGRKFQMGSLYGAMSFLSIAASDINDRMLADFLNMESSMIVTMHIQSVDQHEAIKTVKHTITELDRSKIEEQKKAVRAGYDMDIIPSDLATFGKDAKDLLKELQSQNERMFLLTFLVMNTGRTEQELSNKIQIEEIPYEKVGEFWDDHIKYLVTDGIISDKEDIDYYKGSHYRGILVSHMKREPDKQHMVYFIQDGVRIGAASYCTYKSEDGKCFILDYWVFPKFRGNGTGHRCYEALEKYTRADGAKYYELNSEKDASVRFWKSLGFIPNGVDEYDMPLFIKKDDGRKIPDSADGKRIISIVDDSKRKQKISRCILEELPEWFGIQESREKYIEDSANRVMVASFDGDKPTGFLCLKETGKATVEVAVMGVLKEYHRMGIGKILFEKAREIAIEQGYSFIQVKTVEMGRYKEYDDTNQFY